MRGVDLSHHNTITDWKAIRDAGYEFCFIKCTQGKGYVDHTYKERKNKVRVAGMLLGAYHFADATDPIAEADHFLKNVGELQAGEIVILDYETYALADPASWCLRWLKRVEEKLGFKPLLYTYHGLLKKYDWKKVSDNNNGLWAARYGLQTQWPNPLFKPATGSWDFYALWQYCSKGKVRGVVGNTDLNDTKMNLETLKKYGKPKTGHMTYPLTYWKTLKRGYTFGVPTSYSNFHLGLDIICPTGTPLYAWDDCEVIKAFKGTQGGNTIWVMHDGKLIRFLHLEKKGVVGKFKEGDVIGKTGNTGLSTGPHVHVDISKNGKLELTNKGNFIDPDKYFN